ncbi:hypothetical protein FGB62_55g034 [Gracilaria domingensis]|nr:hypothetical protein FGB62_55g034 [Gracilaria domingensis]
MKIPRPKSLAHTPELSTATNSSSLSDSTEAVPPFTLPPSPSVDPPIATFRASCMRKTRRPQGLNVGRLYVTETQLVFSAKYLNVAPQDANVTIELSEVHHVRRAGCFKRVLPHSVLVKCRPGPDYLMVMPCADHQEKLISILNHVLSRAPRPKRSVKDALVRLASDSTAERASNGAENDAVRSKGSQSSPSQSSPPDANASKSNGSSERLVTFFGKRKKKSDITVENITPNTSSTLIESIPKSKLQESPSTSKSLENEVQTITRSKGFAFVTDITSQMVELTLSVPIPDSIFLSSNFFPAYHHVWDTVFSQDDELSPSCYQGDGKPKVDVTEI